MKDNAGENGWQYKTLIKTRHQNTICLYLPHIIVQSIVFPIRYPLVHNNILKPSLQCIISQLKGCVWDIKCNLRNRVHNNPVCNIGIHNTDGWGLPQLLVYMGIGAIGGINRPHQKCILNCSQIDMNRTLYVHSIPGVWLSGRHKALRNCCQDDLIKSLSFYFYSIWMESTGVCNACRSHQINTWQWQCYMFWVKPHLDYLYILLSPACDNKHGNEFTEKTF